MKKSMLVALLGGCTLALMMQSSFAFVDPNLTPAGHPSERQEKGTQDQQMAVVLSSLNKNGYVVQSLNLQSDGNYSAQIMGPDAKVQNVQVLIKQKQVLDANGQALMPVMQPADAIKWLQQIGYTPETFQIKDGKYLFAANDKSGRQENVSIDPVTKNLSVVEANG